jgi:hypothetical protein
MPCVHGRTRSECKECGGSGICEHGRRRSRCKECGGSGICEHGRERSKCKECGGGSICEHGRQRSQCKECGGGSICEHARVRSKCKECKPGGSGKAPVKKTIQKGNKQKKRVAAPAAPSAAGAFDDSSHSWVPGDQVMYVYADGAKERSACLA